MQTCVGRKCVVDMSMMGVEGRSKEDFVENSQ